MKRTSGWGTQAIRPTWRQQSIVVGKSHAKPEPETTSWWIAAERQNFTTRAEQEYERLRKSAWHSKLKIQVLG